MSFVNNKVDLVVNRAFPAYFAKNTPLWATDYHNDVVQAVEHDNCLDRDEHTVYNREIVCPVCGHVVHDRAGHSREGLHVNSPKTWGSLSYKCDKCGWNWAFYVVEMKPASEGSSNNHAIYMGGDYIATHDGRGRIVNEAGIVIPLLRFFETPTARPVWATEDEIWELKREERENETRSLLDEYTAACYAEHYKLVFSMLSDDQLLYLAGIGVNGKGSRSRGKAVREVIKKVARQTAIDIDIMTDDAAPILRKACEKRAKSA